MSRGLSKMGKHKDGSHRDNTITLLSHISKLVDLFNDKLVMKSKSDPQLIGLDQFYKFMSDWRNESWKAMTSLSSKLWFDLQSMCLGFRSMVAVKQEQFPSSVIKGVGNHFCQVRSCNGQNNNPIFLQQESIQNSIRYGQTTISPKSNVGKASESSFSASWMPIGKKSQNP